MTQSCLSNREGSHTSTVSSVTHEVATYLFFIFCYYAIGMKQAWVTIKLWQIDTYDELLALTYAV